MLGLTFSSKLDWDSYIICIAKTASKRNGVLIRSMKFLLPEIPLYLCKSTIWPCMEYCCHVWAGAPSCCLELLDKLQKRICRTVGPSSWGTSTCYSNRLDGFSVTIPRCYKDAYVNSFFPHTELDSGILCL